MTVLVPPATVITLRCVLVAVLCSGCASMINTSVQTVHVESTPPGCAVSVDGETAGTTPCDISVRRGVAHQVRVSRDGYQSATTALQPSFSPVTLLNCCIPLPVIGTVVAFAVDLGNGAAYSYELGRIAVTLNPGADPVVAATPAPVPQPTATPVAARAVAAGPTPVPTPECKMGSDGKNACGYHCMMGADGRVACADTPDGTCAMNANGTVTCTRLLGKAEPDRSGWPAPEKKFNSDGTWTFGYNCQYGSNGRWYCSSRPDGHCALNSDGTFSCP